MFLVDSKWLYLVGWAICLNCLWLSYVSLLSCGYYLLCVGLNTSYSLWHFSESYAPFWLSVFYTACGVLLALYKCLLHGVVYVWFYPLELSCLWCWSLISLCVMHQHELSLSMTVFKLNMVLMLAWSSILLYTTNLLLMVVFIYYALLLWPLLLVYRWHHLLQRRRLLLRKLTKDWKWTITYLGLFNTLRDIEILSWGEP